MRFRVLDASDPRDHADWIRRWEAWGAREPAAHPDYARLFARPCDRVLCPAWEEGDAGVLFPLVVRPLAEEPWAPRGERRLDALTPYGFGGPFAWGAPRDDAAYWRAHAAWCAEAGIVSTFARLSLFPEELAALPAEPETRWPAVVMLLEGGMDAVRRDYERRAWRSVRIAERAGLEVEIDRSGARLDEFLAVYSHTMERRDADPELRFGRPFFEALLARLGGCCAFIHVLQGREVVSTELALVSAARVYAFLGGTLLRAFPLAPNYLLRDRLAVWAVAQGKRELVIGGGRAPGDSLLFYKRGFAKNGARPFRVAAMIHDPRAYAELAAARAAAAPPGWSPAPSFFPAYRG